MFFIIQQRTICNLVLSQKKSYISGPTWLEIEMNSRLVGEKNKYLKHGYLRNSIKLEYKECRSCKTRTQFTCVVCGFCWSCHWKVEQLAKIPKHLLDDVINEW